MTLPMQTPRFADRPAMLVAGIRAHHPFAGVATSLPAQWSAFRALGALPGQRAETAYGVMCGATADSFEYMTGVEVESFDDLPPGTGRMRIPASHYAVFTHSAHASTISDTWLAVWNQWIPSLKLEPANTPDFEVYDERCDPALGDGTVELWSPVER